jgi:hypothetical protein
MKKLMQRSAYAFAALITVFAVGLIKVGAQSGPAGNGFRISPVRSEYTIDKGKRDTLTITLENPSDGAITAKGIVNDFIASDDESGEPRLILDDNAPSPKNSFKKLVSGLTDVDLAPREKKDITVTIAVPEDASAGGYYGAVRFEPQLQNGGSGQNNVGLTASVGTIVLVRVPGDLTERLDLLQISAATKSQKDGKDTYSAKSFFTSGNVAVMTRLKNSGDIHVKPFGKVQIKNMFGKVVQEFEFNNTEPRANVLPGSTRRFGNDLQKMRWFGRYTIEANLAYSDGGGDLITARASFWYIPTLALFAIILLVLALVGLVYWGIRKQKARKQHKHDVNKRKI